MSEKTLMYALTFCGLYFEMAGAFILSAEAIGSVRLLKIAEKIQKRRVLSFVVLLIVVGIIAVLTRFLPVFHLTEAIVLIFSLGIINDFAPRLIKILVKHMEKGSLGILGFVLFAIGFTIQAYVNLSLLY